jgi:Asp-tRNA(Asn)/Glu-tRNA(Gln) amidotransferase A subunit family amidase
VFDRARDATATAAAVRSGELSPVALAEGTLANAAEADRPIGAFTVLLPEQALAQAREVERLVAAGGSPGPLAGVPVSIKDVVWVKGAPATSGSRAFADFVPTEDAVVVERLRRAGAVLVGKTNNPEFCLEGITANEVYGLTRNPWDPERTPGGSSGGAGASLALGLTPLAIGSDGGGSIRIPSSFCGVTGHKPTFGLVPGTPGFRGWPSLSVKGPMARSVRDLALCLGVIAGFDPSDPASQRRPPVDYAEAVRTAGVSDLRIAVSPDLGHAPVEPGVQRAFAEAIDVLAADGWRLEEAHPGTGDPTSLWATIAACEGYVSHRHLLDEQAERLEARTREILEKGRERTLSHYLDALHDRAGFTTRWLEFFERFDLLLTPTMQLTAFPVGVYCPERIGDYEVDQVAEDWGAFCYPANLAGLPAASVPCGFDEAGLPVGLQIAGPRFADATVLRAAAAFEAVRPWAHLWPPALQGLRG